MTPDEQWSANQSFLEEAIAAGEQIILATPPEKIPPDCTLEKELNYLASPGFLSLKAFWNTSSVLLLGKTLLSPQFGGSS
jgi:hypothetical protein